METPNKFVLPTLGNGLGVGQEINPKLYSHAEWQKLVRGKSAFVRDVLGKPRLFVIGNEQSMGANGELA